MNAAAESAKEKRRARALNAKNKKHPKNSEKTGANYCSPAQDNLL